MNFASKKAWRPLSAILAVLLLAGCASLCTKHLYLYRDTEQKSSAPANLALLITDPEMARATLSLPRDYSTPGVPWQTEEMGLGAEGYLLSIERLEGKPVYQGLCLDTTPTFACEVRAGKRQVQLKLSLSGAFGREDVTEMASLDLAPGGIYFLWPDGGDLKNRRLLVKVERLPQAFNAESRTRLIDWKRQRSKGMED